MNCPCKDCTFETGREIGCHGHCEKYLQWYQEHQKAKQFYLKKKQLSNIGNRSRSNAKGRTY